MSIDVLILLEHNVRELDISCVLKYLLGRVHGRSCEIASILPQQGYPESVRHLRPRVVAMPHFFHAAETQEGILSLAADWGELTIFNLCYEQVLAPWNREYRKPADAFTKQFVVHHAWGPDRAAFLREIGVDERCIAVNGCQALGLYGPDYAPFFTDRAALSRRFGLDASRRWVFIPDQYEAAFFPDSMVNEFVKRGVAPEQAELHCSFERKCFEVAATWWADLARTAEAENLEVILRPRPVVPVSQFQEALREVLGGALPPHLHVIKHASVREWILSSDVVASSHSTTLLEAAWAKKPVVMFVPYEYPEALWFDWCASAPQATTSDELLAAVHAPPSEAGWRSLRDWAAAHIVQTEDPLRGLAQLLSDYVSGEREAPPTPRAGVDYHPRVDDPPVFFSDELPASTLARVRRRVGESWAAYWKRLGIDPLAPAGHEADGLGRLRDLLPSAAVQRLVALSKGRPFEPQPALAPTQLDARHQDDTLPRELVLERVAAWADVLNGI